MKTYEIVFSPTGGTRKVADIITSTPVREIEFVDLADPDFKGLTMQQGDEAVIAVPSYSGRVPRPAAERLAMINGNCARAVIVAVYGNRNYDDTLVELEDICYKQGFNIVAAISAIAEHSVCHNLGAGRPDASDRAKLEDFADKISHKMHNVDLRAPKLPGHRPYRKVRYASLPKTDKGCDECGVCIKACPSHAIDAHNPRHIDSDLCFGCMRCVAVCPGRHKHISPAIMALTRMALLPSRTRKEPELYI